ncbi:hypothetical protein WS98_19670 [Burkholderia territorii]|nr:hypothetical protein WS98_19670 [Burkholderia territorii]
MDPCAPGHQIELRPFETENVGLSKPGRKSECCDITHPITIDLAKQPLRLLLRDPANPLI